MDLLCAGQELLLEQLGEGESTISHAKVYLMTKVGLYTLLIAVDEQRLRGEVWLYEKILVVILSLTTQF